VCMWKRRDSAIAEAQEKGDGRWSLRGRSEL
jgi:hypothetical protein